jgi:hypothetical protein
VNADPTSAAAPPIAYDALRSPGQPLDEASRAFMDPRFGHDFSHVRVHADHEADRLARSVDAVAFTTRSDIFFRAGRYDPTSPAGKHLLAHEAAHVVQQADRPLGDTVEPDTLQVSDPADASEQAANRAATDVMLDRRVNLQSLAGESAPAQVQRKQTEMSLDFLASGSYVTFTPQGWAFSPATKAWLDYSDFPDGSTGEVRIDAGTKATVRIGLKLHIFEDNVIDNEELDQSVFVDWGVSAARDGTLKIDPTPKIWRGTPSSSSIKASLLPDIKPAAGTDHVMINPIVASGGGTGGISMVVGVSENAPPQSVQLPFTLKIGVDNIPDPTGTVTIGEISALRTHEVQFPEEKHAKGEFLVPSDEITKFREWYLSLNEKTRERIEKRELAVELRAHTSTTGDVAYNEWLSDKRLDSVEHLVRRRAGGDVRIERPRALGKLDTPEPDQQKKSTWRKVVISVFEVMSEGENPPGSTPP